MTKLEKSEQTTNNFLSLINFIADPAIVVDANGNFLIMNKAYEKATGYNSADWIGKSSLETDRLSQKDIDLLKLNLKRRASGEVIEPYEINFHDGVNGNRFYELNAKKIEFKNQPSILVIFRDVTRRKEAEEHLKEHSARMEALVDEKVKEIKENAERLRQFLDSSPDGISLTDKDGNLLDCSEAAAALFGYSSRTEVLNLNIFTFIPAERRQLALEFIEKVKKTGCVKNYRCYLKDKFGKIFPAEIAASLLREKGKKDPSFVIITKDVSYRKKLEDDLIASEEKFRVMSTGALNAIVLVDESNEIAYWNPAAEKIFGYTAEEVTGGKLTKIIPQRKLSRHNKLFNEAMRENGKNPGIIGVEAVRKDKKRVPVEITATCVQINNKKYLLGVIQDISARKKMEAEIQQDRDMLESITESVNTGLTIIDKDYHILWANKFLKQVNGDQIENKLCFSVYNNRDSVCPDCGVKKLFDEGSQLNRHDYNFIGKAGKALCVELIVTPLKNKKGKIIAALELAVDVTEKRLLQNQLAEHSTKLERLVEARTRQLKETQAKLVKSERLAAIGELAAMVGHDLRNPLTGMKAATYYLKIKSRHDEKSKAKEMLDMIDTCINQANKIVNDLLEYSRVMKLELTKVNADELLKIALNELNIPNDVKIELQLNAPAKIVADEEKINRLFLNIIKNAFDAMPNGGSLTINTKQTAKKINITFTDNGAGMSKELLKKLGNPLLTTKAKGMGFGIPICKRIVEAHGGKLLIDSTIGKGTKINIVLPVKPKNFEKENVNLIFGNVQMEEVASG